MIVEMTRVRVLGRRVDLPVAFRALQDLGSLHLVEPSVESDGLSPEELSAPQQREVRYLRAALEDIDRSLSSLRPDNGSGEVVGPAERADIGRWARLARRTRRRIEAAERRRKDLEEERELISKYHDLFSVFQTLFTAAGKGPEGSATYCLVLRAADEKVLDRMRTALREISGDDFEMRVRKLETGEAAILLAIPSTERAAVEQVFKKAGVQEVPVPPSYGSSSLVDTIPVMMARLEAIPADLSEIREEIARLSELYGDELDHAQAALHDRLSLLESLPIARLTPHAYIVDGWVPEELRPELCARLESRFDEALAVERLREEARPDAAAPVTLANPRLFRPFEVLVRFFPLPRYGTIDPTPYLAVFFPMFFGLVLGDIGYGLLLATLAWVLHRRVAPQSALSSLAKVAGACSAFSILFGFLYGELFGDLGHQVFGLPSLWFRREEALLPFLALSLALGFVHIVLGLVLGAISALRGERRKALGRGVAAVMVVLVLLALLAAAEVLPRAFFTPVVVALLVAFAILVIVEGVLAPLELLAAVSNIFSYARIMAIGTASVMMAIVANRMVGAVGSVVVGVIFALIFHLVNFVLGVVSPTIHALRLHYVEFYGKFYRPGGAGYDPLRHWQPSADPSRK